MFNFRAKKQQLLFRVSLARNFKCSDKKHSVTIFDVHCSGTGKIRKEKPQIRCLVASVINGQISISSYMVKCLSGELLTVIYYCYYR